VQADEPIASEFKTASTVPLMKISNSTPLGRFQVMETGKLELGLLKDVGSRRICGLEVSK